MNARKLLESELKNWGFTQLSFQDWEWRHPVLPLIIELDIIHKCEHNFNHCLMHLTYGALRSLGISSTKAKLKNKTL